MVLTFSVFDWKYLFGQSWSKNQNCKFGLKFSHICWTYVVLTFSVFDWKYLFGQSWSKNQICQYELKFYHICRTYVVLTFSVQKYFFGQSWSKNQNCQFELKFHHTLFLFLVKKTKIVSLSWNLVPRLIWINGIQWWCSLFLFLTINIFLGQIWSKNSKLFVQSEIWYKD